MTRGELNELGWLLRRGGPRWHKYVLLARELRDGKPTKWSHGVADELARALGLTKHPIPFGSHCPTCPPPSEKSYASTRTVMSLPDRYVAECTRCQAQWVRLTERHHLEPFETRGSQARAA